MYRCQMYHGVAEKTLENVDELQHWTKQISIREEAGR